MAVNQSIEAPDFATIQQEAGVATRNAINLLYRALNAEVSTRRIGVRLAQDRIAPKTMVIDLGANQNNFNLEGCSFLVLTSGSARTITGFRAPATGESHFIFILVIGAGTHTIAHASGSSDAENQVRTQSLADVLVTTDRAMLLAYANSLWRELDWI